MHLTLTFFLLSVTTLAQAQQGPHEATLLLPGSNGVVTKDLKFEVIPFKEKSDPTWNINKEGNTESYYIQRGHLGMDYAATIEDKKVRGITNSIKGKTQTTISRIRLEKDGKIASSTRCDGYSLKGGSLICSTVTHELCSFVETDLNEQFMRKLNTCSKACEGLSAINLPEHIQEKVNQELEVNMKEVNKYNISKPALHTLANLQKPADLSIYMASFKHLVRDCSNFMQAVKYSGKNYEKQSPKAIKNNVTGSKASKI